MISLALVVCAAASQSSTFPSAQLSGAPESPAQARADRVRGAIKHAGTYHLATGGWTRSGQQVANFGPDFIYVNTASTGYFTAIGGAGGPAPLSTNFDEGSVPSSTNSLFPLADRDGNLVNCMQIGYCDFGAAGSAGWELSFYNSYAPCTFDSLPDVSLVAAGLPANGCWTVAFDLTGGGEFCLAGDGGDGFDNDPDLDMFGWSYRYAGTDGSQPAGFLVAGDPANTDPNWFPGGLPSDGGGYYRTAPYPCGTGGSTGLYTRDSWWVEDPTGAGSNCYAFGGYTNSAPCSSSGSPYASFYMELVADPAPCVPGIISTTGCLSNPASTGVNATIAFQGSTSISANALQMTASLAPNQFGFFITSPTPGFVANPGMSQGNLCLSGNIGRFIAPGQIQNSGPSGTITLSTSTGVWDVAAIPSATGPYTPAVGSTTYFQLWFRDVAAIPTSNFTDGAQIVWTQ